MPCTTPPTLPGTCPASQVAFAPGESSKTILVDLLNDATAESSEVFDVVVTSVSGATIGDGRTHAIIAQNDSAAVASPSLSVANTTAVEGEGYVDFLVSLSAPGINPVSVSYNNSKATALNGSDYLADSGMTGTGIINLLNAGVKKHVFSLRIDNSFTASLPPSETF